jgi:hypothetical protein
MARKLTRRKRGARFDLTIENEDGLNGTAVSGSLVAALKALSRAGWRTIKFGPGR